MFVYCWIFIFVFLNTAQFINFSIASKCNKLATLASYEDKNTIVETNLKLLSGIWISEGCETRPGPEYLLRFYTFDDDGNFELIQHRYWDNSCSSPKLTIASYGRITLRNSFFVQPGAYTGVARFKNISVTPQDNESAVELENLMANECQDQYHATWRRFEEHLIYNENINNNNNKHKTQNLWVPIYSNNNNNFRKNNQDDISCLGSIKWAFNELKLIKIQLRPITDKLKRNHQMKIELLLGETHSNVKLREFHSPTSFQVPLIKQIQNQTTIYIQKRPYVVKTPNAIPQKLFLNSKTPVHLNEKPHLPPYIWGEWTSVRCEVRPMSLYLTRKFSFYSFDNTWVGEHKFYIDPFCVVSKFTVTAGGHFEISGQNEIVKGSNNIDFEIEKATLEVLDKRLIYDLRLQGLCGDGDWNINVPKELSSTNGCSQLGIMIPSILYDIVKLEMDYQGNCLLYFGQISTDTIHTGSLNYERPTAFQLPLVRCGDIDEYSQNLKNYLGEPKYYYNFSNRASLSYILILFYSVTVIFVAR